MSWGCKCHLCAAPMDISFRCDFEYELNWICSWHVHKPLNLSYNQSVYKVFGSKVRKVCLPCYEYTKQMKKYKFAATRETTGKKMPASVDRAMSWAELDQWMKEAVEYSKSPGSEYLQSPFMFRFIYWLVIPGLYQLDLQW